MKKFFKWTGIILLGLIAGLFITIELRQDLKFDAPYPDIKASKDSSVIARGKALVFGPAHCANCHTPVELHEKVNAGEEVPLIGGNVFSLPIATIVTPNLTPDKEGIGRLTDQEIARLLRYGVKHDGTAVLGFMPFNNASDEDLTAIISYLRSQPAVKNSIPENRYNIIGKAVKAFLIKPEGPTAPIVKFVQRDTTAAYGKYIANSIANCHGCHTNRDLMTGAFIGEDFSGGMKFEVDTTDGNSYALYTPNLTPDKTGRLYGWTQKQFISRFRMGKLIKESHMPWGPFSRMSDDELKAIWNYLQTLKPVSNVVPVGVVKEAE